MTTFKVGDTVRLPLERPDTTGHTPSWNPLMAKELGKTSVVVSVSSWAIEVKSNFKERPWFWYPSWLTLVSEAIPEKPINKVLARSLKLEQAFKDRQKNKKTIKPTVISIDGYPLSF